MKILVTGPQGSGKTTQAEALGEFLNLPVIDPGQMLRELAEGEDKEAIKVQEAMAKGVLVDDEIAGRVVRERLEKEDCKNGFIIDGYPREVKQLEVFDPKYDTVFYLDLSDEKAIERMVHRSRADDTPEAIKKRLEIFHQRTQPVLDYYHDLGILERIKADDNVESIQQKLRQKVQR